MAGAGRDRALALDLAALVETLAGEGIVAAGEAAAVRALAQRLRACFHHEFFAVKERLRAAWERLEAAGTEATADSPDERELAKDLLQTLRRLLARANFTPVPLAELSEAMARHSSFGLRIELDLGDFADLAAWRRREGARVEVHRRLFGLRRQRVEVPVYDRFCVFARFKGGVRFEDRRRLEGKLGARPGGLSLRLFREVPKHDVEALFPGVRVRMRGFDQALIGVPAAAGALQVLNLKLLGSLWALLLALMVLLGLRQGEPEIGARALGECMALAVVGTFVFRQWARFLGRKNYLHRRLAEHLTTCTLDSGFGVLLHLLDEAEEEETAEALLAWAFLRRAGAPVAAADLDARVEEWLSRRWQLEVDFEEEDAVGKLERLGLVERDAQGRLAAAAPEQALARLDLRWRALLGGG